MRRTALFLGGLVLAAGSSLALSGPALATDSTAQRDAGATAVVRTADWPYPGPYAHYYPGHGYVGYSSHYWLGLGFNFHVGGGGHYYPGYGYGYWYW
ncbi:hypothetical protein AB0F72_05140 [Actinoplanes sp. NPDC023936]|uniref:hypothetical protein n=1 Tax=Actinoplanes sp. NPDC023936 TaxID=3154910 RepID=UPI0033D81CBB